MDVSLLHDKLLVIARAMLIAASNQPLQLCSPVPGPCVGLSLPPSNTDGLRTVRWTALSSRRAAGSEVIAPVLSEVWRLSITSTCQPGPLTPLSLAVLEQDSKTFLSGTTATKL